MPSPKEIEAKFWSMLKKDRTMMLGLYGVDEGHTRPMTANLVEHSNSIWFFGARNSEIAQSLANRTQRVVANFTSKGHDVFATLHGLLKIDDDRDRIDQLWNPFVAAWYQEGKGDPNLVLFRLDAERAEIWLDGSNILAGIKMLFGADPKEEYKDQVAEVRLG
jgi:general stress protein 26